MSFQGQTGNVWKGCEMKTFINLMKDQSGASAAEYALILAIVGGAIALAAITLGKTIGNSLKSASNCISKGSSAAAADCP
jgi:pilus assembly protein Flp/PilA